MADVSIVIPSYNTKRVLLDCLQSIVKAEKDLNVEIIVVDNNSTDGSANAAEKFVTNLKEASGQVIRNKENFGFAKAVNQGIKVASSKYILLLNSDIVVKKGSIHKMIKFCNTRPSIGVVGGRLYDPDGNIQKSCTNFPTIKGAIKEYFFNVSGAFSKYIPRRDEPAMVDVVSGAAFMITPEALKEVGLLNERFFMYYEEIEYCKRVYERGLKVFYLPTSGFIHYHGLSGENIANSKNQWKRLIPSSKTYHGLIYHYCLTVVLWLGQKYQKLLHAMKQRS